MQSNTNQTLKGGEVKQCILIESVKIVQLTAKVPSDPPDLDFVHRKSSTSFAA